MERDLEDLKTRMRRALENPKKVAEIAVASLRSPYNAYKVVLESTGDKQLAQDWRNILMLKRDQGKYGVNFAEELTSVFPEIEKEDKMLEALKQEKERRELVRENGRIVVNLFKNIVLLLIKKGVFNHGSSIQVGFRSYEELWTCSFGGEVSEEGVSKPVYIYSRLHFCDFPKGNIPIRGDRKEEIKKRLTTYIAAGDFNRACPDELDILNDIRIDIDDEEGALWFSVDRGTIHLPNLFGEPSDWNRIEEQIDFLKELNAWVERQIGS